MAFVIALTLGFIFLDGWLRVAVITGGALIELAEIAVWVRWRKVRSITGTESMVGMTGIAITAVDPEGQVKVKGQIWKARSRTGVEAGAKVRVAAVEGLRLDVDPA